MQEARVYSHDGPIGRRKRGYILTADQSGALNHVAPHLLAAVGPRGPLGMVPARGGGVGVGEPGAAGVQHEDALLLLLGGLPVHIPQLQPVLDGVFDAQLRRGEDVA
eukprot:8002044-Pyramimonas_sp.AAC.2